MYYIIWLATAILAVGGGCYLAAIVDKQDQAKK